jgi:hypothetical protein
MAASSPSSNMSRERNARAIALTIVDIAGDRRIDFGTVGR